MMTLQEIQIGREYLKAVQVSIGALEEVQSFDKCSKKFTGRLSSISKNLCQVEKELFKVVNASEQELVNRIRGAGPMKQICSD